MSRGWFVVLEGIDGSGTTTQADLLSRALGEEGWDTVTTREPTPGPVGQLLRQALTRRLHQDGDPIELDWKAMALLFAADRVDHCTREIEPALSRGSFVICDRYDLSSLIYQSLTSPEGLDALDWLRSLNGRALRPDLTVVLDVPEEVARGRREARSEEAELFERSELQRLLAAQYARASELMPQDQVVGVSGVGTPEEVADRIRAALSRLPEFAWK